MPEIVQPPLPENELKVSLAPSGKDSLSLRADPVAEVAPPVVVKLSITTEPHPAVVIVVETVDLFV